MPVVNHLLGGVRFHVIVHVYEGGQEVVDEFSNKYYNSCHVKTAHRNTKAVISVKDVLYIIIFSKL